MRRSVFWIGLILLILGIVLFFLAGAVLGGNKIISLLYGTNQIWYVLIAIVGLIITIIGLFLKKKQ